MVPSFLNQTTSSSKCSYNKIIYSCVLQQWSTLIGSTVQEVISSISRSAKALLRNVPYQFVFLEKCQYEIQEKKKVLVWYCTASMTKYVYITVMLLFIWGWDYVSELRPSAGLLFIPQTIYEYGEQWWNDIDGKTKELEEPVPMSICPPQIPHGLALASATNCLSHGTTLLTYRYPLL
jgi:hypothetical protein